MYCVCCACGTWVRLTSLMYFFFFFNDTATTEIYTLSLHDALPISLARTGQWDDTWRVPVFWVHAFSPGDHGRHCERGDRKSTRLNSSHSQISYAVFCLKKKKYRRSVFISSSASSSSQRSRQ